MDSDDDFAPSKGRMRLSNLFGRGKTEDTTADDFQFRPTQKRSNKPNRKDADTSAVDSHIVDVVEQNHQSRNTNSTNVVLSTVQVFRNQQIVAPKAVCLLVVKTLPSPEALQGFLYCYDHQKKGIFQVKLSKQFVFFQRLDEAAEQYCSVYDPAIQEHWTLRFKSEDDAERFAINASLLKYCLELFSNDSLPDSHVVTCTQPIRGSEQHVCGNGMKIMLSYRIWSLETVDTVFKLGSIIDENSLDRDGGYTFHFSGDTRALMPGWVYALQGSRKGTSKLVFLLTSDQIGDGFGNVSSTTPCAVYFMVHSVESNIKISTVPQPKASQIAEQPNLLHSFPPNSKAASVEVPPPNDSQQLVLNTLLSMLQQPAQRSPITSSVSFDMERALDRLSLQISSLYEKIDRQNVERYLEANNAKLELMIRKTLGKAPSGDLGVDLSAESNMDKVQLLAQIENQRNRIQTLTESYHNALEQIGKEKEAVRSLQADLGIERESTLQRIHDISERKRLEAIEMEMRLREGIENELRMKCDEAFSKGYTDGLETGRKEATEGIGTHAASSQALKALELEKEKALVQLRTELNEKERIILQDRKASDERLHAVQVLLQRFEEKEKLDLQTQKQLISAEDAQALLSRHLKKIMNNLYYSIEEHFNSLGKDTLTSTEALGVVTKTIKSETKNALGWLKEEISTQVKKVPSQSDVPLPLDHTPQMASPSAQPARDTVAEESTQPTEVFKQIPTALGLSLAERIQAISESRTEINEEEWM